MARGFPQIAALITLQESGKPRRDEAGHVGTTSAVFAAILSASGTSAGSIQPRIADSRRSSIPGRRTRSMIVVTPSVDSNVNNGRG
jgi:hypothetical protein